MKTSLLVLDPDGAIIARVSSMQAAVHAMDKEIEEYGRAEYEDFSIVTPKQCQEILSMGPICPYEEDYGS
jgi:hypothetical protein